MTKKIYYVDRKIGMIGGKEQIPSLQEIDPKNITVRENPLFVLPEFTEYFEGQAISFDTCLKDLIVDSLEIFELIIFIDDTFKVKFEVDELLPLYDNLTLGQVSALIIERMTKDPS